MLPTYVLKERILKSILCCTRDSFLNVYGFFFFFSVPLRFWFSFWYTGKNICGVTEKFACKHRLTAHLKIHPVYALPKITLCVVT